MISPGFSQNLYLTIFDFHDHTNTNPPLSLSPTGRRIKTELHQLKHVFTSYIYY